MVGDNLYVEENKDEVELPKEDTTATTSTNQPYQPVAGDMCQSDFRQAIEEADISRSYTGDSEEQKTTKQEVANADQLVPVVGLNGKREEKPLPEKAKVNKALPAKKLAASPNNWIQPRIGKRETNEQYLIRVETWKKKKEAVERRLKSKK